MTKKKEYLLQNCGAGFLGNSPIFWQKGDSGYTQWIDDAKRWTYKEAKIQMKSTSGTHKWKLWPLDVIESVAKRTVDIQDLNKI